MAVFALATEHRWSCPLCPTTAVTHDQALPLHVCAGMRGLTAPLSPDGVRCKVEPLLREDYVGRELVQTDGEGRAVMAVRRTRDDGEDLTILAPCATANAEAIR